MEFNNDLALGIIRALGLPDHVARLEIVFSPNAWPLVRCEYALWPQPGTPRDEKLVTEFREWELRPKGESVAPSKEA